MRSLNEKCAVVGVFDENAAKKAYLALFAMQHRGQEASGISSSDGKNIHTIKDRGLVNDVFNDEKIAKLTGKMAIGHNRYSTAGDDSILDAQPVFARYDLGEMAIVHNGNLTNAQEVRKELIKNGSIFQSSMDTENLIHLIAKSNAGNLKDRILEALAIVKGAYSFIFLSRTKMFVARDPHGFRPLSLGKIGDGYIVASETCAFDLAGAKFIRDVEPGEMLIFEKNKEPESVRFAEPIPKQCIFEHIYFARPDSVVFGESVYNVRKELGRILAREMPVEADMVVPVPDSSVSHALGYSEESKIPFEFGIIRNHYVGRTFIEPMQEIRDLKVKMKLSPIKSLIQGKKLVIIDDSIVRGTTSKKIVSLLRDAGAKEIHMRIASPAVKYPCFYGIDTPEKNELISNRMDAEEIRKYIGADSLSFLSVDALCKGAKDKNNHCLACFNGSYF
ncbi:MAG: amidophosphoribosyltransferase [Campylobacterota bacterium]|nr:amidophosphoribosyltransferase [Campylobacterota bacterium]